MVLAFLKRRKDMTPYTLYRSVMEQARDPLFFTGLGVADTIEGRFDLLVAHAIMLLRRLKRVEEERAEEAADRSQALTDILFKDIERALRETGVSDVRVPKKLNALAGVFYGRGRAFGEAIDAKDLAMLEAAIDRNFATGELDTGELDPGENEPGSDSATSAAPLDAGALARYLLRVERGLSAQPDGTILAGEIDWPSVTAPGAGESEDGAPDAA